MVERSFLLVFFLAEPLRVTPLNELQANAHSGAIPKSFSSSESQLHGGAWLGVFFVDGIVGIIENGEIRCLMSVMMVGEGVQTKPVLIVNLNQGGQPKKSQNKNKNKNKYINGKHLECIIMRTL